jgi:hypothetical protein
MSETAGVKEFGWEGGDHVAVDYGVPAWSLTWGCEKGKHG